MNWFRLCWSLVCPLTSATVWTTYWLMEPNGQSIAASLADDVIEDILKLLAVTLCHGMRRGCPPLSSSVFLSSPPLISPHHLTSSPPFTSPSRLHHSLLSSLLCCLVLHYPHFSFPFLLFGLFSFWPPLSVIKISDIYTLITIAVATGTMAG